MVAAAVGAAQWQASAVHTLVQKMPFIFSSSKLNFEPHNELTFVSLVEGVGGKIVVATKKK